MAGTSSKKTVPKKTGTGSKKVTNSKKVSEKPKRKTSDDYMKEIKKSQKMSLIGGLGLLGLGLGASLAHDKYKDYKLKKHNEEVSEIINANKGKTPQELADILKNHKFKNK